MRASLIPRKRDVSKHIGVDNRYMRFANSFDFFERHSDTAFTLFSIVATMSKYANLRPAGMSDEDDEDDEYYEHYVFSKEDKCNIVRDHSPKDDSTKEKAVIDFRKREDLETRVMKACITGNLEEIQKYLEQYDINKFLYTGWSPLLYATSSVQPKTIEYLLLNNADSNIHKDGFTPLMALCNSTKGTAETSLQCLTLLIEAKANVNITNKRRETALMYACKMQNAEFIAELIKYVNNIDACDSSGRSALSYATVANNVDVVKVLLEYNADSSLTDINNVSAKDIAEMKGFLEISALLAKNEEFLPTLCKVSRTTWKSLFPDLCAEKEEKEENLNYDILEMLYGMGLEGYNSLFQGMDLKTFLQLTDNDICRLGIDITVHREKFLEGLEKFHNRKWCSESLGIIRKTDPYTIYDGVLSLANAKKQIGVIASSFKYIENNLMKAASEDIHLSPTKRMEYEGELRKTQKTLNDLKSEIMQIKELAQKIDKENNIGVPATFIGPKRIRSNWTIMLGVTLMIGLCLCKTTCIQRLSSMCNVRL